MSDQSIFPEWRSFLGSSSDVETQGVIKSVVKRSGEIAKYDRTKIETAIGKAIEAVENKYKQQCSNVNKLKNERNAGRKERFNNDEKATIQMLRLANHSYRAIAKQMGCSVGTIHKIIKELEQG